SPQDTVKQTRKSDDRGQGKKQATWKRLLSVRSEHPSCNLEDAKQEAEGPKPQPDERHDLGLSSFQIRSALGLGSPSNQRRAPQPDQNQTKNHCPAPENHGMLRKPLIGFFIACEQVHTLVSNPTIAT